MHLHVSFLHYIHSYCLARGSSQKLTNLLAFNDTYIRMFNYWLSHWHHRGYSECAHPQKMDPWPKVNRSMNAKLPLLVQYQYKQ